MSLRKFTLFYVLYNVALVLIAMMLPVLFPGTQLLVSKFWVIFGFLSGITFIAYLLADLGIKKNPDTGIMAIMGAIAVKMLFCMAFVLVYSVKGVEKPVIFMFNFFSLYLLFTVFEISSLLLNLRHQNK